MRKRLSVVALLLSGVAACRPSDILSVPAPAGVVASGALASQAGAEGAYTSAKYQLESAIAGWYQYGVLTWSGLLSDEFTASGFTYSADYVANIDARVTTAGGGFGEIGDIPWQNLLTGRSVTLLAVPGLAQYEPASGQWMVGEAYALVGLAELFLAEDYCAGTTLDQVAASGGLVYGTPLTTDSLLGVAVAHFDSALAHAAGNATVQNLASVGLGRALLDRGQDALAATAAAAVPVAFVYNTDLAPTYVGGGTGVTPNLYAAAYSYPYANFARFFNVADREGENGLNFVSAQDPRLVLDSSMTTQDGGTWYLPTKFEANFSALPLATGVEGALIGAEAALQQGDVSGWATDLNALRAGAPGTYLQLDSAMAPLAADSTTGASATEQVDIMFRERAFWLFGLGTRLGDLRRLVRQYGRDQSTVYPTGPYPNGHNPNLPSPLPNYGTDVDLTLPTGAGVAGNGEAAITNPNYKGCLTSTKTA